MELSNVVAIITGGARGIGRAIAAAYCARGARVAIVSRSANELQQAAESLRAQGGRALAVVADVSDPDRVEAMASQVEDELGPADILINNAGRLSAVGPVWEVDPAAWRMDVTVNLYGAFLCSRAVLRRMLPRRRGYVINMVGGGASDPHPYATGYGSSKAALMRFTEGLAQEAREFGIKVFALDPGTVRTAMTESLLTSAAGRKWRAGLQTIFDEGRDLPPTRAAQLAVDLVSGRADALSGRYFSAADNFEAMIAQADAIVAQDLFVLRIRRRQDSR